jgi:cytochrome b561
MLAVPTFVLSLVHGVFAGTDSARPAMWWTYVATGLLVVFLLVVRGLTAGFRPERGAHPTTRPRATTPAARPGPAGVPALPPPPRTGDREHHTLDPAVA